MAEVFVVNINNDPPQDIIGKEFFCKTVHCQILELHQTSLMKDREDNAGTPILARMEMSQVIPK